MKAKLYELINTHKNARTFFWYAAGSVLVGLFGILDYLTGTHVYVSLFYILPIVLVTWWVNQNAGLFVSFLSTVVWLAAEFSNIRENSPGVFFWNTLIHASFFVISALLVDALQKLHQQAQQAARTDFLTGAQNKRYFYELVQMEIDRIQRYRHPFTLVYIDLDNFKKMNDMFGHEMGDEILRTITSQLKSLLRSTDIVARLGGDEFAVLLPFTDQAGAETAVRRVHTQLKETVKQKDWLVTVSMGSVTCVARPASLKDLINSADQLMYEVKKSTKNDARFITVRN